MEDGVRTLVAELERRNLDCSALRLQLLKLPDDRSLFERLSAVSR